MFIVTVQKTVTDPSGDEILYTFSATAETLEDAERYAFSYASMVEYGMIAERWQPTDYAFPKDQLYQFIQRNILEMLESMTPDIVGYAYSSALAYVKSYIGNMFDVDAMLDTDNLSITSQTLRLALCISTSIYILASSPDYSDVIEQHNKQLIHLLKGLKAGSRNMGKDGIISIPDVRLTVVNLNKTGQMP